MSRTARSLAYLAAFVLMVAALGPSAAHVDSWRAAASITLYVDDDAPPGGDGLSWATAFRYLQDALAAAQQSGGQVNEIRVAQGTYKPDQGAGQTPLNRSATFMIPSGLALRGSYAGIAGGGADPDAREWNKYETVLSGDLAGNDPPYGTLPSQWTPAQFSDNSRRVVTLLNGTGNVFEGLTIRSGRPNSSDLFGAGLHVANSKVKVEHCHFWGNWGQERGGGAGLLSSQVTIDLCKFEFNRATFGGGMYCTQSAVVIHNSHFYRNNWLVISWNVGGGIHCNASNLKLYDSSFVENFDIEIGGAIGCFESSTLEIERCEFKKNLSDTRGGAVAAGPNATIKDSLFALNRAGYTNGAVQGAGTLLRCLFVGNYADISTAAAHWKGAVLDCVFEDNLSYWMDGGALSVHSGPVINCVFKDNFNVGVIAPLSGGGAVTIPQIVNPTHVDFINCAFTGNYSGGPGGAVLVRAMNSASLINCSFSENITIDGEGGAISGNASIVNSIVWGNSPAELEGPVDVAHSNIKGGWPGVGNIDADPLFVNAAAGDLRLRPGSPCIDAGDNTALPPDKFDLNSNGDTTEPIPIDVLGLARFRNDPNTPASGVPGFMLPPVDMGAFEFQLLEDINQSGVVNVDDLLLVINSWGPCPDTPPLKCAADVAPYPEGNGVVDVWDLIAVIAAWGQ